MASDEEQYVNPAQMAELSALADGTLDPSRRADVEQSIRDSPHLRDLYQRERTAVEALRQAAAEQAPPRLRARVEAERAAHAARPRRRAGLGALAGALAAAAAVALVLLLPGGTPGSPSVSQAAQLALRGPAAPAPAADPGDPRAKLTQRLQDLYFPNWSATLGWRAVGVRHDKLGGRPAVTVYYQRRGTQVAYTIVGTPALVQPSAPVRHLNGFDLRALSLAGRTVVTWQRAGHTCVLSGPSVPAGVLEQLAAWRAGALSD